jgi:predicted permease
MGKRARWRSALRGGAEEAVDLEILHHIDELTDRLIAAGASADAARLEAEARFGDMKRIRHDMVKESRAKERRMQLGELAASIVADLRYAVRGLRRNPVFAATVILTVSLGLGAAASVFTVLDALLLRPLPYREPERLVTLGHKLESGGSLPFLFGDQLAQWREAALPHELALYEVESSVRTDGVEPTNVAMVVTGHEIDEVLGMRPWIGRAFGPEDARPGVNRTMLTWSYWQRMGGSTAVLGSTIELDGLPHEVVGVMPRDFKFPVGSRADLWVALATDNTAAGRTLERMSVLTRLVPGATREALQSTLDARASALKTESPHRRGWGVVVSAATGWRANPDVVRGVWMLAAAVGLMLLVALVNGVNLLLFRGADRAQELAVRVALGGGRARMLRHVLSEGLVIGLAAGFGAVAIAAGAVAVIQRILPDEFLFASVYEFRVQERVLVFTFAISLLAGLVLGLIPGLRSARRHRPDVTLLKARTMTRAQGGMSHALVGLEVALVVALLAGAGLLTNSVVRLMRVDPGFDVDGLITLQLGLPETRYPTPALRADFFQRLEERLEARPEIRSVAVASGMPPQTGFSFDVQLQAEGAEAITPEAEYVLLPVLSAGPDFLAVLGARLLRGRDLASADVGTQNVLIDHTLARALWGSDEVGRQFRIAEDQPWRTVVGVFEHMRMLGLNDRSSPWGVIGPRNPGSADAYMALAIRSTGPAGPVMAAVRETVRQLDDQLPIYHLGPARDMLLGSIDKPTFLARIMMSIAVTALLLTGVGIYGVLSYSVTQRRREMGIRLALGSLPGHVRVMVVRAGLFVAAAGIVAGLAAALALSRLVASLLYGVEPADPLTLGTVVAIVFAIAAIASYIPARRATRVDPVEVLRAD